MNRYMNKIIIMIIWEPNKNIMSAIYNNFTGKQQVKTNLNTSDSDVAGLLCATLSAFDLAQVPAAAHRFFDSVFKMVYIRRPQRGWSIAPRADVPCDIRGRLTPHLSSYNVESYRLQRFRLNIIGSSYQADFLRKCFPV